MHIGRPPFAATAREPGQAKGSRQMSALWEDFEEELARLRLSADEFEESFVRSAGPGGQNVNKVSTAVELRHRPSGVSVTVQDSRSQLKNRLLARQRILAELLRQREARRQERRDAVQKKLRATRKRPRGVQKRILEGKRQRSQTKALRRRVSE
jgi:protein subunit release factor B